MCPGILVGFHCSARFNLMDSFLTSEFALINRVAKEVWEFPGEWWVMWPDTQRAFCCNACIQHMASLVHCTHFKTAFNVKGSIFWLTDGLLLGETDASSHEWLTVLLLCSKHSSFIYVWMGNKFQFSQVSLCVFVFNHSLILKVANMSDEVFGTEGVFAYR